MNCSSNLRIAVAAMSVALAGSVALVTGCSSMAGEPEMAPTTYVAVAPFDLPDDYEVASNTVYVPVAPLDLPNDYYNIDSDTDEIVVANADSGMIP